VVGAGGQSVTSTKKYVYSFCIWPDETWDFDRAVFDLFKMLNGRLDMVFAPHEFERFRSALSHHGFTLREGRAGALL
jgi:hypothetical protein